jgi:hypothetical protein
MTDYIEAFVPMQGALVRLHGEGIGECTSVADARARAKIPPPYHVVRVQAPQHRMYLINLSAVTERTWYASQRPRDIFYTGDDLDEAWRIFELHVRMLTFNL